MDGILKSSRNMLPKTIGFLAALVLSVSGTGVPSPSFATTSLFQGGCQTWEYFLDTWRIVPERLAVNGKTAIVKWHIADVYIPGTPGAKEGAFEGSVVLKLDAHPAVSDSIYARASDSERPRTLALMDVGSGRHRLTVSLFAAGGFKLGQFESCFDVPSHTVITRQQWHDLGGEGRQTP